MTYFKWDGELDISVDNMNEQHKILIGIMNDLYELNDTGASKIQLAGTLDKLASYTRFHFNDEERFMESMDYDDIDRHKIIHKNLLAELEKHIDNFNRSHDSLNEDFFYFLRYWLSTHIRHIDRKYGNVSLQLKTAS